MHQIESGAFLADVSRRKINRHALPMRKLEAAISQCGLDAFPAFFYGVIRQANDVEIGHARRAYIHLHFNQVGVDAVDRSAECLEKHREGEREMQGAA